MRANECRNHDHDLTEEFIYHMSLGKDMCIDRGWLVGNIANS